MSYLIKDYYFPLLPNQIAQSPASKRDESKLMVISANSNQFIHTTFKNCINFFNSGDLLVLNDTKVFPARLKGLKKSTGGKVEILLLKELSPNMWEALVSPAKRLKEGKEIVFNNTLEAKIVDRTKKGSRILKFSPEGKLWDYIWKNGLTPLPPYIKKPLSDPNRYQTIYAKAIGSVAAPTAGLHFTKELLEKIKKKGVNIATITLHIGLGTFRPVKTSDIREHKMEEEFFYIPPSTVALVNATKRNGKNIIAVGTTSLRALETAYDEKQKAISSCSGTTNLFIYPGYEFKVVDALITNFHLPCSTLFILVCSFMGREKMLTAYKEAIDKNYRFFSFGDACLLLKKH